MSSAVKKERISPSSSMSALQGADAESVDEIQEKIIQLCGEYPKGCFLIDRSNEAINTRALPFCVIHLSRLELAFLVSSKIARSPRIFHSSDYFSDDSR